MCAVVPRRRMNFLSFLQGIEEGERENVKLVGLLLVNLYTSKYLFLSHLSHTRSNTAIIAPTTLLNSQKLKMKGKFTVLRKPASGCSNSL